MIEWYMIFIVFMNSQLNTTTTSPMTKTECMEQIDSQVELYTNLGIPLEHMTAWCQETEMRTLEQKEKDNTKPEFAN